MAVGDPRSRAVGSFLAEFPEPAGVTAWSAPVVSAELGIEYETDLFEIAHSGLATATPSSMALSPQSKKRECGIKT
jgi:hypothetical protein